jgi:hypothetical protein
MIRPRMLFVTRSRYWRAGNGEATRTRVLVEALAGVCELIVFFPEPAGSEARAAADASPHPYRLALGGSERPERAALLAGMTRLCGQLRPDVVLLSRLQLDFLRLAVPPGVRLVMDTHDLVSDNAVSRQRLGIAVPEALDFERELGYLRNYDRVLLIQPDDQVRVAAVLGERALCVPHPVVLPAQPVRPGSRVIGYGASQFVANQHGLRWFLDAVWPQLGAARVSLEVAGHVASMLPRPPPDGIRVRGFVPRIDDLWAGLDIAINPVRWGSGLKIKTVEALAAGLPLVTTREGARGLEDMAGDAFLMADEPDDFASACRHLLDDYASRAALAARAHRFARSRFTPEACFGGLVDWLRLGIT